jgi:putative modified peptide
MSYRLPGGIAETLLQKLATDDAFRDEFRTDSRQALASLGFEPARDPSIKEGIWNCLRVQELASKEVIRASHALMFRSMVTQNAGHNPISLDVHAVAKAA